MQTLGSMKLAVKRGCQLCAILMSPHSHGSHEQLETYKIGVGDKEMLYLRRSPGCPERGVALVAGPGLGADQVSQSYFSRVPSRWTGVYNCLLYYGSWLLIIEKKPNIKEIDLRFKVLTRLHISLQVQGHR